ncbi:MAG: ATPase inhibitor subunit zeta [Pseudomonadota bacterium]
MQGFTQRREFFEKNLDLDSSQDFKSMSEKVKLCSLWAADKMGYKGLKREHYMRANVANIVRENKISKMIARIEKDLFEADIDYDHDEMINYVNRSKGAN